MKIALLLVLSALGLWYNVRATRSWWSHQRLHLPKPSDFWGWLNVGFSGIWYGFIFVFFAGLTVNNTLFR